MTSHPETSTSRRLAAAAEELVAGMNMLIEDGHEVQVAVHVTRTLTAIQGAIGEVERLERRARRQHCLSDCGHDHHYFVMEIAVGPLTERTVGPDHEISDLFDDIAEMAMDRRDDADCSAIMLSAEVLGWDEEGT